MDIDSSVTRAVVEYLQREFDGAAVTAQGRNAAWFTVRAANGLTYRLQLGPRLLAEPGTATLLTTLLGAKRTAQRMRACGPGGIVTVSAKKDDPDCTPADDPKVDRIIQRVRDCCGLPREQVAGSFRFDEEGHYVLRLSSDRSIVVPPALFAWPIDRAINHIDRQLSRGALADLEAGRVLKIPL